jgi:hypothetical protein
MNTLRSFNCSARSSAARTALTADIFLSRIDATNSAAVGEEVSAMTDSHFQKDGRAALAGGDRR